MPRFSHRKQILRALDNFLLLHITTHGNNDQFALTLTTTVIPIFLTALTLASTNLDDDLSDICDCQDDFFMMIFMMMTLTSLTQQSEVLQRKHKREQDDLMMSTVLWVRNQAQKWCYVVRRFCRPLALSKAETFNGWFRETNCTWWTVVCFMKSQGFRSCDFGN